MKPLTLALTVATLAAGLATPASASNCTSIFDCRVFKVVPKPTDRGCPNCNKNAVKALPGDDSRKGGVTIGAPASVGPQPNPWRKLTGGRVLTVKPALRAGAAPSTNLPAVSNGSSSSNRCTGPAPPSWCWRIMSK